MKSKILNTLAIMTLLLWCATSRAQIGSEIIYSNFFNPSGPNANVSVEYSAPTYITPTNLYGASATATWALSATNINPIANPGAVSIYQGGTIGTNVGTALLPLVVQTNAVYIIYASLTVPASMPTWVGPGFTASVSDASHNQTNLGFARFNDAPPNGFDWLTLQAGAKTSFFAGSKTTLSQTLATFGGNTTHTIEVVLSTLLNTNLPAITNFTKQGETNDWVMACFIDGSPQGSTNVYYSIATPTGPPPLALNDVGIGQNTWVNDNTAGVQWNYFTLSTPWTPIIELQPSPTNVTMSAGVPFALSALAMADTNGGPLMYQWYTNGVPLANGGNISGATSSELQFSSLVTNDASTNLYLVVTNTFGAVTSVPVNLTVIGTPEFITTFPVTYTNLGTTNWMYLYGGSGANYGSTPTFQVSTFGQSPIFYYWFTNGVYVGGATNASFTFTNCQMNGPTTFACLASNLLGTVTNTWGATYLPTPTTPFQQAVLGARPLGYWRLNDTNLDGVDNNNGDDGYLCHDYASANDGFYTNVILNTASGYSPTTDPTESSALFGGFNGLLASEDANSIGGNNIDFSGSTNAEYTVSLWANGYAAQGAEPGNGGLFCKGYFSAEEACIDTDPHTFNIRFTLRNAGGTQVNAVSSEYLGTDPNWHFITAVCDEANGVANLYIDGVLQAQSAITPGSGIINSATTPIMIGARSSTATSFGDNQFEGNLNDVAVYGYAMSAGQIISQYESAGYTTAPYVLLLSPLPPTNIIYLVNSTVTIPATTFSGGPFGYYWTNTTAGGILGSGSAAAAGSLNASLTIPNISQSLSGDQLELVVTNGSVSTNWFVNLVAAPAPVTLGYTNAILYSNSFNGGSYYSVNATAPSAVNMLMGGTATTWVATFTNAASTAGTVLGNGMITTNPGEVLLPFTARQGFIYTMNGSLIEPSAMADFVHMGFCQSDVQSASPAAVRFNDSPINGYDFVAIENASITFYRGVGAANSAGAVSTVPAAPTTNLMQIVVNCTTNNAWAASAYINGTNIATTFYTNVIAYCGIGEQVNPGSPQWQYWSLDAVSPNGFPPYLLTVPATNSILLTNATINLSATGYGTGPWGYYWINNSTVVASGTTNNTAPNIANLSIPSTSLSGGLLQLVLTNSLGTNITSITLITPVNATPTNIVFSVTNNNNLRLSWPTDHTGWQLQAQTNSVSKGIGTNWANVNPSTGTNVVVIPITLTNGTVFYRITY